MTVRECDDGRVLVHCFAGCAVELILGALGLEFDALFPEKTVADRVAPMRRPFPMADVFACVAEETFYVAYMAATMAAGHQLTATDKALLEQSYHRIMDARRYAIG